MKFKIDDLVQRTQNGRNYIGKVTSIKEDNGTYKYSTTFSYQAFVSEQDLRAFDYKQHAIESLKKQLKVGDIVQKVCSIGTYELQITKIEDQYIQGHYRWRGAINASFSNGIRNLYFNCPSSIVKVSEDNP